MKDHYQVLNVSPAASHEEIRKAFRRLALRYHPDKNPEPAAKQRFAEIQEAWYVLKDRQRRIHYNQQRFVHLPGKQKAAPQTAEELLQQASNFYRHTLASDPFRLDRDYVCFQASRLLTPPNLALTEDHPDARKKLLEYLLAALAIIPFPFAQPLLDSLHQLAGGDEHLIQQLRQFIRISKRTYYWNRYKVVVALMIALLFCLLLFFA